MNNEPVAWINRKGKDGEHGYLEWDKDDEAEINTPLYTHPVKELHLSLQKSKQTGELLAVTYTDDEHRIVEVLWSNESHKIATIAVKSNELGV